MQNIREAIWHFFSNKTNKILSVVFVLAVVLFFSLFKNALIILFLILLTWLTKFYQKYVENIHFGFDFTLMSAIVTAYAYGALIGTFTGIVCLFLTTLWTGRFTPSVFFAFFSLSIIAILASGFNTTNITFIGITLSIIYDIILYFAYMTFFGGKAYKGLIFAGTHTIFNIWAFSVIAPKLLIIM